MLGRRTFLQSSVALAVVSLEGLLPPSSTARAVYSDVAIADQRLDGSSAFIARARASGSVPLEFANDVAALWMHELEPRLRTGSLAVAGYTSAATLFCLELLARDYGARIVERTDGSASVAWLLSSRPLRRGPLAPLTRSTRG
jgi:hypothetical protein